MVERQGKTLNQPQRILEILVASSYHSCHRRHITYLDSLTDWLVLICLPLFTSHNIYSTLSLEERQVLNRGGERMRWLVRGHCVTAHEKGGVDFKRGNFEKDRGCSLVSNNKHCEILDE